MRVQHLHKRARINSEAEAPGTASGSAMTMSDSTIRIPHKIGSEQSFAAVCASLLKEEIRFEAVDQGDAYVITLLGY